MDLIVARGFQPRIATLKGSRYEKMLIKTEVKK